MPSNAPDSVTNPRQRELWRDITRLLEDYCGDDAGDWPEREREFTDILFMIGEQLNLASAVFSQRAVRKAEDLRDTVSL